VEDNPADVELTLRALRKSHIANEIIVLRDGQQALDYFFAKGAYVGRNTTKQPKVVLLDLKLPKIDGLEVLKELKNNEKTRTIPVVVLTSSKEESDVLKSYKLGANSYLVKPVDFDRFLESVGNLGLYWLLLNQAPDLEI
jgi:CheY-like chemotaxis protein